ncbi:ATP-binding protein [Cereibacter johrii]|uniref:ATP-binding protein n=1 Tax=Cereibacter johrii TaxID=445629 RepID=UPI000DCC7F80|nr:ATP-binding protein [Cereibacter johrii]RAZ84460.1 ATP-binding protein [Cereibacter johrii]
MTDTTVTPIIDLPEQFEPQWGANAPRGGKSVLNRVLREGTRVPLFLGQTFINSLRDVGYDSTTSALCEHVDNAIQAGAKEIRVYFNQSGSKGNYNIDALVFDDGRGMSANVLQVAMAFGGSMFYDNREGIGRFGVGMKTAALSMGPAVEVYSWTEPGAIYTMTLDIQEISSKLSNLLELPEPQLLDTIPSNVARILTRPMAYPRNHADQYLLSESEDDLLDRMGKSGTIVFIPDCDRVTYKKSQTLADHAIKEMARIYRVQLSRGLRLYVNNRRVEAFDPTYWDMNARHTKISGLEENRSRLIRSWTDIQVPVSENSSVTAPVAVRLYMLPMDEWYDLPRKVLKNDLRVFDDHTVSFMRNNREVFSGTVTELSGRRHGDSAWMRIQIDFSGALDEAFGVAMNKQGVRPKKYALDVIRDQIKEEVSRIREKTAEFRKMKSAKGQGAKLTEAERRANDADVFQAKPLPSPAPTTDEERQALEANLRALAVGLKRDDETDEEAYERVARSRFITTFKHDEYWPFYHVDYQLGKVILTINTAHPFYMKLYDPIAKLGVGCDGVDESDDGELGEENVEGSEILVALQMLLFSLGRAQSQLAMGGGDDSRRELFDALRREWSQVLKTQLTTS